MKKKSIDRIKEVFDIEISELCKVRDSLDEDVIASTIDLLSSCKGKIILCGMGKPGHIGRKISATMSSMGISFFISISEVISTTSVL